jgi:hypothetical protein
VAVGLVVGAGVELVGEVVLVVVLVVLVVLVVVVVVVLVVVVLVVVVLVVVVLVGVAAGTGVRWVRGGRQREPGLLRRPAASQARPRYDCRRRKRPVVAVGSALRPGRACDGLGGGWLQSPASSDAQAPPSRPWHPGSPTRPAGLTSGGPESRFRAVEITNPLITWISRRY